MARDKLNVQRVILLKSEIGNAFFPTEGTFALDPPPPWNFHSMWQGLYMSWKTWKVMEFKHFIFQAWKEVKINSRSLKVMENEKFVS